MDQYDLRVDPKKCTLYLLAGGSFRGDVSYFQALGVKVVIGMDVLILKALVGDGNALLYTFLASKRAELEYIFDSVERLS